MKGQSIAAVTIVFGIAIVGGAYFYTTTYGHKEYDDYANYLQKNAEEIVEKEQGTPGKGTIAKPTSQTSKSSASGVWVLTVSFNSLNSDLFITDDKEGTLWMDHARFDRELTAFETSEKAQLAQTTANWQAIIGDPNLASQMIVKIQNDYKPIWQSKLQQLQAIQNAGAGITTTFQSRWGIGCTNVPVKYKAACQWNVDVNLIVDDSIKMVEMNLAIKDKTIANIQSKNVSAAVISANDEDRITLVSGWYEERLGVLWQQKTEMTVSFGELIKEYPR